MPSCNAFPICRLDWLPDARLIQGGAALALLAALGIGVSGLSTALQAVLILSAWAYAAIGLRQYARQPPMLFEAMAYGACLIREEGRRHPLFEPSWCDWGYLVVMSGKVNGKQRSWFWVSYLTDTASLRELRLLVKSHERLAKPGLPSVIINPVL